MVGSAGEAPNGSPDPAAWVQDARRAATRDLLEQLADQTAVERTIVATPDLAGLVFGGRFEYVETSSGRIHVGHTLWDVVERFNIERLLYFGGGSAPLLDDASLSDLINRLAGAHQGIFTNNQFATDWAGIVPASILDGWQEKLPQDNMLGWVLSAEAGLPVEAEAASAASRLDIDTPADLLTLSLHPGTRQHLRRFLATLPLDTHRLKQALAVLATPASHVFIAGRIGPDAWQALNRVTRCWLRVVAEERGMLSSGRLARGEVYSLLADHITTIGVTRFFEKLADQAQAAFIDSRVLLGHQKIWPAEADRFASDLGFVNQIKNPWLREFTASAMAATIPVVLGGHGLLSGDLLAFCDLL